MASDEQHCCRCVSCVPFSYRGFAEGIEAFAVRGGVTVLLVGGGITLCYIGGGSGSGCGANGTAPPSICIRRV